MGGGPIVGGAGLLLLVGADADADYVTQVLPGVTLFGLGLALTVAPLTATVLSDADQHHVRRRVGGQQRRRARRRAARDRGRGSGGGGPVLGRRRRSARGPPAEPRRARGGRRREVPAAHDAVPRMMRRPASAGRSAKSFEDASVSAFRVGIGVSGALVVRGGLVSAVGIRNPRRKVAAAECPGGAICGASEDLGHGEPGEPGEAPLPEPAAA